MIDVSKMAFTIIKVKRLSKKLFKRVVTKYQGKLVCIVNRIII